MDETRIQRALRQGPPFRTPYVSRPIPLDADVVGAARTSGSLRLVTLGVAILLVIAAMAALAVGSPRPPALLDASPSLGVHVPGAWTEVASLTQGRRAGTATLLVDGRVLVVGGATTLNGDGTSGTEAFDPVTRTWAMPQPTITVHIDHTATLLMDGRVLVVGGRESSLAEIYDPGTGTWAAMGQMSTDRSGHTATLLPDGAVLVAGGWNAESAMATTEVFDPQTGTWHATGAMAQHRGYHTATLLRDGRVLVVGGTDVGADLAAAELYDPDGGTWTAAAAPPRSLLGHTATLLTDGTVLFTGGWHSNVGAIEGSAMVYDPAKDGWAPAADLLEARGGHTATLLGDGSVLVAGGFANGIQDCGKIVSTAERFDPIGRRWSAAEPMAHVRYAHLATALGDGSVLVTGGTDTGCMRDPLPSVELYGPAAP